MKTLTQCFLLSKDYADQNVSKNTLLTCMDIPLQNETCNTITHRHALSPIHTTNTKNNTILVSKRFAHQCFADSHELIRQNIHIFEALGQIRANRVFSPIRIEIRVIRVLSSLLSIFWKADSQKKTFAKRESIRPNRPTVTPCLWDKRKLQPNLADLPSHVVGVWGSPQGHSP